MCGPRHLGDIVFGGNTIGRKIKYHKKSTSIYFQFLILLLYGIYAIQML